MSSAKKRSGSDAQDESRARSGTPCDDPAVKKARVEESAGLLDMDDPSLLLLLTLLPLQDRLRVADVCSRLRRLCGDTSLWVDVDTLSGQPIALRDLRKLLNFLHERTNRIAIRGFLKAGAVGQRQRQAVSPSVLAQFENKCPRLDTLALQECYIDGSKVQLDMFPKSIKEFLLPSTEVVNIQSQQSYFHNLENIMPHLRVLDLSGCGWLSNQSLMAICKCQCLEELNLKGCFRIGVCFVYSAVACRFGFRALKKLDLRDTSIGNSEVPAFGRLPELTHLKLGKSSASLQILRPSNCEGDGEITDRGLISMCPFSGDQHVGKIQHLTVTHLPRVTNRVVTRLASTLPLKSLDVTGTKVSAVGESVVKGLRPSCRMVVDPMPLDEGEEEEPATDDAEDMVILQLNENHAGGVVVMQQQPLPLPPQPDK